MQSLETQCRSVVKLSAVSSKCVQLWKTGQVQMHLYHYKSLVNRPIYNLSKYRHFKLVQIITRLFVTIVVHPV